jgi:hypothetical protein
MPQKEKWIGRSRRWQAAAITILTGLVGFGLVPQDIVDPVNAFLDTITGDSGLLVAGLQTWGGLALILSYFRPDNAKVKLVPKVKAENVVAILVYLAVLGTAGVLLAEAARAADPACAHMLTAPDPDGTVFDVESGNVSICTPALSSLGNPLPAGTMLSSCTLGFGQDSLFTTVGPFEPATVVTTPIPLALELDHPMRASCEAEGKEGAVLMAVARFPFSGPSTPGLPR